MDDRTPSAFLESYRTILRGRIGQIALAIALAWTFIRLIANFVSSFAVPLLARLLAPVESVFLQEAKLPFPWLGLAGTILEAALSLVALFYLVRWVQHRPEPAEQHDPSLNVDLGSLAVPAASKDEASGTSAGR